MSKPTITQADRDAAETALAWCDDMNEPEMVDLFARHREAATLEGIHIGLEEAAKVAEVYSSIHVEKRDDTLAAGKVVGALTIARQAQTCDELANAIRALDPATIREANNAD